MLRLSWQLTPAVLVMIPLVGLPARRAGRATYQARARTQSLRGQMTGYLQEILGIQDHAGQGVRPGTSRAAAVRRDERRAAEAGSAPAWR
jgi:ABC-type multidrug transport system fused ATPase/permease subunit